MLKYWFNLQAQKRTMISEKIIEYFLAMQEKIILGGLVIQVYGKSSIISIIMLHFTLIIA